LDGGLPFAASFVAACSAGQKVLGSLFPLGAFAVLGLAEDAFELGADVEVVRELDFDFEVAFFVVVDVGFVVVVLAPELDFEPCPHDASNVTAATATTIVRTGI
jgi:hypothetical protein